MERRITGHIFCEHRDVRKCRENDRKRSDLGLDSLRARPDSGHSIDSEIRSDILLALAIPYDCFSVRISKLHSTERKR